MTERQESRRPFKGLSLSAWDRVPAQVGFQSCFSCICLFNQNTSSQPSETKFVPMFVSSPLCRFQESLPAQRSTFSWRVADLQDLPALVRCCSAVWHRRFLLLEKHWLEHYPLKRKAGISMRALLLILELTLHLPNWKELRIRPVRAVLNGYLPFSPQLCLTVKK